MKKWTLPKITKDLKKISDKGWVKTKRAHDTGVGKTLEDLLGIKENNIQLPDLGKIELKAKRLDSGSMLTIATKSPLPKGINKILFEKYKYSDKEGGYNLHSTVYGSRNNPQSFRVLFETDRLLLKNKFGIKVYWPISIFEDVIKSKSNKIILVFAQTKGKRCTLSEHFHYIEAYILEGLDLKIFKMAVLNDRLKVDIRIGSYRKGKNKGKYHDHGTAFRIGKKDFLELFDSVKKIL